MFVCFVNWDGTYFLLKSILIQHQNVTKPHSDESDESIPNNTHLGKKMEILLPELRPLRRGVILILMRFHNRTA